MCKRLEEAALSGNAKPTIIFAMKTKTKKDFASAAVETMWGAVEKNALTKQFTMWHTACQNAMETQSRTLNETAHKMIVEKIDEVFLEYLNELAAEWRAKHEDIEVKVIDKMEEKYQKPYCFYPGQLEPGYTTSTQTRGLEFDLNGRAKHAPLDFVPLRDGAHGKRPRERDLEEEEVVRRVAAHLFDLHASGQLDNNKLAWERGALRKGTRPL